MDRAHVAQYLDRIGIRGDIVPDRATLRDLHAAHLRSVPFENLSIHLGEPISLDPRDLFDKIVGRRRGGFCFELNGAFAELLQSLGYEVTMLGARVWSDAGFGLPLDHLALMVEADGPLIADVGFGAHSLYPVDAATTEEQPDPGGRFSVQRIDGGAIVVSKDGEPAYELEPIRRSLGDFEAMAWWHQTSPRSHFTLGTVCTLQTLDGRVTLTGNRLIRTFGSDGEESVVAAADLLPTYTDLFGIELSRVPEVGNVGQPDRRG